MGKWSNLKIEKVWFDDENIYILTNDGTQKSHPLRWFDRLWNATPEQREKYELSRWCDSIHWSELDEDLSLEGFFTCNIPIDLILSRLDNNNRKINHL
jgi:hypothetical protein